jgi:hypothetical protein
MDPVQAEVLSEVEKAFVQKGSFLNAIKAYNDRTKAGLKISKKAVEDYGDVAGLRVDGSCPHCSGTGKGRLWKH